MHDQEGQNMRFNLLQTPKEHQVTRPPRLTSYNKINEKEAYQLSLSKYEQLQDYYAFGSPLYLKN